MKYVDTAVTFSELPNEICLCINISNCPVGCVGCHSSYLAKDIGEPLTKKTLLSLIKRNKGITAVCFMGGDANPVYINELAKCVKKHTDLSIGWYSGREEIPDCIDLDYFEYIKLGPYKKELGPLNSPTTNQRMYSIVKVCNSLGCKNVMTDITYMFRKRNGDSVEF